MIAVGGLSAPSLMGRSSTSAVPGQAACLLPPPAAEIAGFGGLQDDLLVAYADRLKQGANEARSVGVEVVQHRRATAIEQKKMTEARERQQAAERASHGLWAKLTKVATSIAKVAALVAGAAATVATGGTGAPFAIAVAGLALSGGGMAVRELKLLGRDSERVGFGLEVAGAVVGAAGAVAGAMKGGVAAASATARVAGEVRGGAMVVGAAATGAAALGTVKVAGHVRDSRRAEADAEEARGRMERHQSETHFLVETLDAVMAVEREALVGTAQAIDACNRATSVAIAGVRG